jgi:hypothetical protein
MCRTCTCEETDTEEAAQEILKHITLSIVVCIVFLRSRDSSAEPDERCTLEDRFCSNK